MRLHLVTPLLASIAAPLLLASGAPAPWQPAAFGAAMLPLAGVALVSRRGALADGQMIGLLALAALACVAGLAAGPGLGAGLFLLLLPFEAATTRSMRAMVGAAIGAFALGLVLVAASANGFIPGAGDAPLVDAAFGVCALGYALCLARGWRDEAQIQEQLHARERAEHAALRSLVRDLPLQFNRSGVALSVGANCESVIGLRPRDLTGRGFFERVQVADRPVFLKMLSDAARTQGGATARLRLRGADVEEAPGFRHVEISARQMSGEGESAVVVALMRDVTDLVEAERILAERPPAPSEDLSWKGRLLANVSHELRTPLNAIIGFSEMLGSHHPDETQRREYAGIINASGHHLLSVVNSILDMSRIEAGRFQISAEPFDVAPVLESCCDILGLKARAAGVEIARDFGDVGQVVADERACRQIVLNLLSNAIKFTPEGGRVTVAARIEGESFELSITDTGIGVSTADLPRLGDPFFQARAACDRQHEGTGLGLSVVKGLVGLHGGAMSFESAPGQGACVTVRLPRDCRAAPSVKESATIQIIPRRPAAPAHDMTMVKKIA